MTFGLLFLSNEYLRLYVTISSYLSVVFLIYQAITLIDFGYVWNENWVAKYENGNSFYGILLIVFSLGMLILNGIILVGNFHTFWISNCYYYKVNLIVSVFVILALLTLTLLKIHDSSSILTALFVSLVFNYYNGLSLASFNNTACNPYGKDNKKDVFLTEAILHILINSIFGIVTIFCLSVDYKSSDKITDAGLIYKKSDENGLKPNEIPIQSTENQQKSEALLVYQSNYYVLFHLIMTIFSIYLVMIFFDWRDLNINIENWSELLSPSFSAFWIKTISNFVFVALYVWTIFAPRILSDRNF